ncbi:multiple epidermal growth factor-like domains protein 10 [Aricia agestis]|uniref:multiple epidermal growth factor-like domains protein 10 n=1 Tax=Aricia agestis TaxID=91739 RepID=UPI001C207D20|nr:multiple epidermal growth factor-like domains protein 10 [Aricia agestis]
MYAHVVLLLGAALVQGSGAVWQCGADAECGALAGGVCAGGACVCTPHQEPVLGGTLCVDRAPYHLSSCVEDHQCARLVTRYHCAVQEDGESSCLCQAGHHYFSGRCWATAAFGEACTADEQCLDTPRDPYSLKCEGTCVCADGYYQRQRGECRKRAAAVGERCVLDQDCDFTDGACDAASFTCYNVNDASTRTVQQAANVTEHAAILSRANKMARQHGGACDAASPCPSPFECSAGACLCPWGYYPSANGASCLAELGSPSTVEQCGGLLAEVVDGRCVCPANFFYEENMRDCVKVTRRIEESCVSDASCHTFGAASRCGPAQEPWGFRYCECVPEDAVWDADQYMCRLFAGVGEPCEVDGDCMAGELEVQCRRDELGQGYCACPDHLTELGGLCLTTGLELGEACQDTFECTGTDNTVCAAGACTCADGYVADDDNNICAPIIGGACSVDGDCVIEHTVCSNTTGTLTCQCDYLFIEYDDACWPALSEDSRSCAVSAQCAAVLGEASACAAGECVCSDNHHERDGRCWPITELFSSCSRSSECYLREGSERAVCRNGLCQCDFAHPYSDDTGTCMSGVAAISGSVLLVLAALYVTRH